MYSGCNLLQVLDFTVETEYKHDLPTVVIENTFRNYTHIVRSNG